MARHLPQWGFNQRKAREISKKKVRPISHSMNLNESAEIKIEDISQELDRQPNNRKFGCRKLDSPLNQPQP
jgi:hypothetical protein